MSRISTYPIQDIVVGSDKWIGTDAVNANATKNFTADAVALFLNNNNKIEVNALRYKYQNWTTGSVRDRGTITFSTSGAGDKPFNTVTQIVLSQFEYKRNINISPYYTVPLLNSSVLISQADDPSSFGIYTWNSVAQRAGEPTFYDIGLTLQASTGTFKTDKDYFISLLTYGATSVGDKNYVFTQSTNASPWIVNHGLNKYPSVSIVNSADITIYAEVEYDSLNQVTITFNSPTNGKAYFN